MEVANLSIAVDSTQVKAANQSLSELVKIGMGLEAGFKGLDFIVDKFKEMGEYAKEAVQNAARFETLGVVMTVVGNNVHQTSQEMEAFAKGLEKTGISMLESRQSLTRMAQAHIDLAQSQRLARVAQDAAVIGNINSSDAFQRMTLAIEVGQVRMLRTLGINVNFEASYQRMATQLHKNVAALSEEEKVRARVETVLKKGLDIQGAYEASMQTLGKQMLSSKRYAEDLSTSIGEILLPMAKVIMFPMLDWLKDTSTEMKKFVESMDGKKFIDDVVGPISSVIQVLMMYASWVGQATKAILFHKEVLVPIAVLIGGAVVAAFYSWAAATWAVVAAKAVLIGQLFAEAAQLVVTSIACGLTTDASYSLAGANTAVAGTSAAAAAGLMLVAAAAIAIGLAFVYALDKYMGWSEETAQLEEETRRQEEFAKNVMDPLVEKIKIKQALVKEEKELADAIKHRKSVEDIPTAAEAKKQKEHEQSILEGAAKRGRTDGAALLAQDKATTAEIKAREKRTADLRKKAADQLEQEKKTMQMAKQAKENFRKDQIKFDASDALYTLGADASDRMTMKEKQYSPEMIEIERRRKIKQAQEKAADAHRIGMNKIIGGAGASDVLELERGGYSKQAATNQVVDAASLKAEEEFNKLKQESIALTNGETEAYRREQALLLTPKQLTERNILQKQNNEYDKEAKKIQEDLNVALLGETEAYKQKMLLDGKMRPDQIDEINRKRAALDYTQQTISLEQQLTTVLEGEAAAYALVESKKGKTSSQITELQAKKDALALINKSDIASQSNINEQRRQLDSQGLQILGAERLKRAYVDLDIQQMKLKADAGDLWAIMGVVVVGTSQKASDSLVTWMDNLDKTGRTWKTFGNVVKSVLMDMIVQMQKAIMQQLVMKQLFEAMGIAMGAVGGGMSSGEGMTSGAASFFGSGTTDAGFTGQYGSSFFRAAGGTVAGGQSYVVGEKGPEIFTPGTTGSITPNNAIGGGGGNTNHITVNVTSQGGVSSTGNGDNQSAALGRMIAQKVREVMVQESRQGGIMGAKV